MNSKHALDKYTQRLGTAKDSSRTGAARLDDDPRILSVNQKYWSRPWARSFDLAQEFDPVRKISSDINAQQHDIRLECLRRFYQPGQINDMRDESCPFKASTKDLPQKISSQDSRLSNQESEFVIVMAPKR